MAVPAERVETDPDRAELMIALPSWWKFDAEEEGWSWPLRWLKILTRLPWIQNTWLGWGIPCPQSRHSTHLGREWPEFCWCIPAPMVQRAFTVCCPGGGEGGLLPDRSALSRRAGLQAPQRRRGPAAVYAGGCTGGGGPCSGKRLTLCLGPGFCHPGSEIRPMLRNWRGPPAASPPTASWWMVPGGLYVSGGTGL